MRTVILVLLMVCCFSVAKVKASLNLMDGSVHNIDFEIVGDLYVQDNATGYPTTVNLLGIGACNSI